MASLTAQDMMSRTIKKGWAKGVKKADRPKPQSERDAKSGRKRRSPLYDRTEPKED